MLRQDIWKRLFCFEILVVELRVGLLEGQFAAGPPNDIVRFAGVQELKAVAESVTLANHGVYFHISMRQVEFQANHFVGL